MNERKVKLYALSTCFHCNKLKKILEKESVVFEYVEVDTLVGKERRDMLDEVKQVNKRCTFPTIVIGEQVVVGFKEYEILEALGVQ